MIENTARKGERTALIASKPPRKKEPGQLAIINQAGCTGCEACISFCPVDCIELVPGVEHAQFQQVVEVDIERCIGCALCSKYCPWETIPMLTYADGIQEAPSLTVKSVCNQKSIDDINVPSEEAQSA